MDDSKHVELVKRIAAGQVDNPVYEAAAIIDKEPITVARLLEQDPFGLRVEFAEINTSMLIDFGQKRKTYLGEKQPSDVESIEWWEIVVKSAICAKWFKSPSNWIEGSVGKMPPAHTHWLSDLIWLHSIEIKRVPFLST